MHFQDHPPPSSDSNAIFLRGLHVLILCHMVCVDLAVPLTSGSILASENTDSVLQCRVGGGGRAGGRHELERSNSFLLALGLEGVSLALLGRLWEHRESVPQREATSEESRIEGRERSTE